jgi:UDP-N-acetylglucosamine diphosphorylase / glucose-1-phosphate thymidylyltransferase / UDP-N-acetylgalactosamine diphosphorylase / glucosamine-1-phosphate N-acetyltransferase / galactosamine-1-phosphate N-acetyltransferase
MLSSRRSRVKVLLLLAGRSRRFWPLAEKSLFPVCGKTLLEHQIDRLKAAGLTDVLLITGKHNMAAVTEMCPELECVEQRDLDKGMQGALLDALPRCGNESVLVVSGNDVIEPGAYEELAAHLRKADGAILAKKVTTYFPGGYLTVSGERVTGIVEKPGAGNEPSDLVNIVAHAHKDASVLLDALGKTASDRDDAYEKALDALFKTHEYVAHPYGGEWGAVKYPWHILSLSRLLLSEIDGKTIHPSASVHPSAVIEGNVVVEEGARILPNACVVGPAWIGKRAIVGNNALIRGSSVGDDCVVGFCCEVKDSVLHRHCWMHMSYAGDSVLGENVAMGAGTITGNLRLDEGEIASVIGEEKMPTGRTKFGAVIGDDCRIGIHVGINPGVKIGRGSFVSSGVIVSQDLPDSSYATMKDGELHVRENRSAAPKPAGRDGYKKSVAG